MRLRGSVPDGRHSSVALPMARIVEVFRRLTLDGDKILVSLIADMRAGRAE